MKVSDQLIGDDPRNWSGTNVIVRVIKRRKREAGAAVSERGDVRNT